MEPLWRVCLFDGPILKYPQGGIVHHFRSQRIGALLAYLSLQLDRPCPREELAEALWPEEAPEVTANRLRVALASLRKQLEPPGVPFGSVLDISQARRIRLRADAVWCDVKALEQALKTGDHAGAAALASGPLLPDYYDEWAIAARERFTVLIENLPPPLPVSRSEPTLSPPATSSHFVAPRIPHYLTRFFGRERELQQLRELLKSALLVSVVEPGGIGKSRLAVELAAAYSLPVALVPLANLSDPRRLVEAVLQAVSPGSDGRGDSFELLCAVLSTAPMLLILDNAEPFVESVASLVLRLIDNASQLQILVTTRQRLEVPGEAVFALAPLEPPPLVASPERLMEFPAVALFVDRARCSRPDFVLAPRHTEAIVEICQRLEGIPLALELAAAQVTVQTPRQIVASLAVSLTGLKSRQRELVERHRSLRAVVEGSLKLLPPPLRLFFFQLSIFRDGWTAEAAAAVTGYADAESLLEELAMRSLVIASEDRPEGPMRYRFLEVLRQFADESLPDSERVALAERHCGYFLACASRARGLVPGSLTPLDSESENLRAALEFGAQSLAEIFWPSLRGVLVHAFSRGLHRQVMPWIERLLEGALRAPDALIGYQIEHMAAKILVDTGRFEEGRRLVLQTRSAAERTQHFEQALYATTLLGYIATETGDYESAVTIQREALEQADLLPDPSLRKHCQFDTARALLVCVLDTLSHDEPRRQKMLREAESLFRPLLNDNGSSSTPLILLSLAITVLYQGRLEESYPLLKKAQRLAWQGHEAAILLYCLAYESHCWLLVGNLERAAILQGAYEGLREQIGYVATNSPTQNDTPVLRDRLGEERFAHLVLRGRQTHLEELLEADAIFNVRANTRLMESP